MRSAASCSRCSRSASSTAWSCGLVAQSADAVGDLAVLVGDALEELGALEQVAEAVGLEHHGQRVGGVGLVDLHEPRGEQPARGGQLAAQARQAVAGDLEPVAHLEQLGLLAVEARPVPVEPLLGGADLALELLDRVLKLWIVVLSTPSFCLSFSISARFWSMRLRQGRGQPRQGQHEVGRQGQE